MFPPNVRPTLVQAILLCNNVCYISTAAVVELSLEELKTMELASNCHFQNMKSVENILSIYLHSKYSKYEEESAADEHDVSDGTQRSQ